MGQRPLEVAATLGRRDLVEALVDGGASSLEAALLAVCSVANALSPHCDVVAALVRLGVDVHCRNEVGKTPQVRKICTGEMFVLKKSFLL